MLHPFNTTSPFHKLAVHQTNASKNKLGRFKWSKTLANTQVFELQFHKSSTGLRLAGDQEMTSKLIVNWLFATFVKTILRWIAFIMLMCEPHFWCSWHVVSLKVCIVFLDRQKTVTAANHQHVESTHRPTLSIRATLVPWWHIQSSKRCHQVCCFSDNFARCLKILQFRNVVPPLQSFVFFVDWSAESVAP